MCALSYRRRTRPTGRCRTAPGPCLRPFRAPSPEVVVAFEADADAGGQEPVSCPIAAERLEIVRETVLRYWREDAAPGQRFVPWVLPPVR